MKYLWEIVSVVCTVLIAAVLLSGMVDYLFGKCILGISAGFLGSAGLKVIGKLFKKEKDKLE